MIDNIFKKPKDPKTYGNLFLERIPENVTKVLTICVGYYDTLIHLMWSRPDIEFIVIDKIDSVVENLECTREITPNLGKTFGIQSEEEKDLPKELESIFKTLDTENMLIIMNPPYGRSNKIVKSILSKTLTFCEDSEIVCLAPITTYKTFVKNIKSFSKVENLFESVVIENLGICKIDSKELSQFTFEEMVLNKNEFKLFKAIQNYNELHENVFIGGPSWSSLKVRRNIPLEVYSNLSKNFKIIKNKTLEMLVEEDCIFYTTPWTPSNGVHRSQDAQDYKLNVLKQNLPEKVWNSERDIVRLFIFKNKESKNNFTNWWYSCNKNHPGQKRFGLTNKILDIIVKLYSGSAGVNAYSVCFPNLDWSRAWTDEEIIQELKDKAGLPQDWNLEG